MEPLTKKQGMMKKLFVICSWALLLGGCKSESGASDPDGDKPVPPPSAELLQKIEDLNAGLVSLKTLAGAVSQSEVRSLAETEDGVRLTFCDGTEVTVACNAAAEAPLIGIAGRRGCVLLDTRRGKGYSLAERCSRSENACFGACPRRGAR